MVVTLSKYFKLKPNEILSTYFHFQCLYEYASSAKPSIAAQRQPVGAGKKFLLQRQKKIQKKQESKHETQTIVRKLGKKLLRWLVRTADFESRTIWTKH